MSDGGKYGESLKKYLRVGDAASMKTAIDETSIADAEKTAPEPYSLGSGLYHREKSRSEHYEPQHRENERQKQANVKGGEKPLVPFKKKVEVPKNWP